MKILEVILSFTPWTKSISWDAVINQLADKTKEDPISIASKVNDWKQQNIGGTPEQAFKALTGDKTAVLKSTEMPGVDLTKQPPEDNGQWIDQGRWWVSKEPILGNGKHEFAIKPDLQNPTTWPLPNDSKKCPSGEWKAFNGRSTVSYSWVLSKDGTMCVPVEKGPNAVNPEVKPVDGKCPDGYKLSANGQTCIPDGTAVIPPPSPEKKDPEKKDPEKKDPEKKDPEKKDPEKKDPEKKDPEKKDPDNKVKIIWPAGNASMINRNRPLTDKHNGIDIKTPLDTDLVAPESGKITKRAVQEKGAGLYLILTSTDGKRVHIFMHLLRTLVDEGATVTQGQQIGSTGGEKGHKFAGNSTGPHLHWGVSEGGKWIDPETLVK